MNGSEEEGGSTLGQFIGRGRRTGHCQGLVLGVTQRERRARAAQRAGSAHALLPDLTLVPVWGLAGRLNPREKGWPQGCLGFGAPAGRERKEFDWVQRR